jgi:hypothetical protein
MDEAVYICTGGCGAVISQKQFDEGLQACGAEGCPHKGHAFEKRMKCSKCGALYIEGEQHTCK